MMAKADKVVSISAPATGFFFIYRVLF